MTLAAGYVAVTVILALILFATFRYLWPTMKPHEPVEPSAAKDIDDLNAIAEHLTEIGRLVDEFCAVAPELTSPERPTRPFTFHPRPHTECVNAWADGKKPCGRCESILPGRVDT